MNQVPSYDEIMLHHLPPLSVGLAAIEARLALLEDPSRREAFDLLLDAYRRYRMVEAFVS